MDSCRVLDPKRSCKNPEMHHMKKTKSESTRSASQLLRNAFASALLLGLGASASAVQFTTQHADAGRSGANLSETVLTQTNVSSTFFGKIFDRNVEGEIYAQPLALDSVTVANGTIHNVVYVATTKNKVYCFDAEDPTQSAPLWSVSLGNPVPVGDVQCCCTDMSDWVGIVGTPVIDATNGTLFVIHKQKNGDGTYHQYIHALNTTSGAEKFSGPVEISATVSGVSFDAKLNNQRAGLLLQGGNVYAGWSSHNDCGAYHGWIIGYSASTLSQTAAYTDTVTGSQGGIWMSGGGLVGDGTSIFFTTGNGTFDLNSGGNNAGESFLRLNSSLVRQDYFTPASQAALNSADKDLGGGGIMLIPGTTRLVGGGKDGKFYLVSTTSMGGYNASTDACIQSFMVTDSTDTLNHLHGGPVYFDNGTNKWVYTWGESDECKAFAWNGTTFTTTPASNSSFEGPANSMPGGQLAISANGTTQGILWTEAVFSGNANNAVQPGILRAFNATDLTQVLWDSHMDQNRDDAGLFAKNPGPVVVNGKLYQATFSQRLAAYGNFPTPAGVIYEAENAAQAGGAAVDNNHNNFSGTGFVDGYWNAGANTTFTVNAGVAGAYVTRLHYANATGSAKTLSVYVNGTKIKQMTLNNVGSSWDQWGDEIESLTLNAGSNTIKYLYDTGDTANVNLDYIELSKFYEAESGTLAGGAATATDHNNYSGTGFVAGFEAVGASDTITVSVPVAGPYNVRLHYANALNGLGQQATQTLSVYVNSTKIKQISLSDLGTWDLWGDETETLTLNSGSNTIKYSYDSGDTAHVNLDYIAVTSAPLRSEAESLTVAASSGGTVTTLVDTKLSGGNGSILNATAAAAQVTYSVSVPEARTYDVKVRVKNSSANGIFQCAIAPTTGGTYINHGPTVDEYSASAGYSLVDIGQVTFGSASTTKAFRFTVTGKNASSSGFAIDFDYLLLIPN